jgi:hypothetical protein
MPEPTTSAGTAAVTGFSALVVALFGVEPQAIVYGAVGAFIGFVLVAQIGRLRAAAVFVPVVLLCALLGTAIAAQWFGGAPLARNASAAVLGVVFQPLLSAVVAAIPAAVDSLRTRFLGAKQ